MTAYIPARHAAAKMRQRVTIQQPEETQDEYGQPIVEWSAYISNEPAELIPLGGTESIRGRQLEANVRAIFRVHYREGYTSQMRVSHDSRYYGILYVEPVEGGRRYLDLLCTASGDL